MLFSSPAKPVPSLSLTPSLIAVRYNPAAVQSIIGTEGKAGACDTYDLAYLMNYPLRFKVKKFLVEVIEGLPVVEGGQDKQMKTDVDDVMFLTIDFLISVAIRGQQKMRQIFLAIDEDKSGTISWDGASSYALTFMSGYRFSCLTRAVSFTCDGVVVMVSLQSLKS